MAEKKILNNDIVSVSTGKLGVGTTSPASPLHIHQPSTSGLTFSRLDHDNIDLSLEGANRFVISNTTTSTDLVSFMFDGKVGIGTTSPSEKLHVVGDIRFGGLTDGDWAVFKSGTKSIQITQSNAGSGGHEMKFRTPGWSADAFIYTNGSTERFRITGTGNVGIGTSSPTAHLEIQANDGGDTRYIRTQLPSASTYNPAIYNTEERVVAGYRFGWYSDYWQIGAARGGGTDVDGFIFSRNGSENLVLREDGNVGIGTNSPTQKLSVHSSDNTRIELYDTGENIRSHWGVNSGAAFLTTETNHPIKVYTSGTERMRITSTGNVGIGTTSPAYKLDVSGSARFFADTSNAIIYATSTSSLTGLPTKKILQLGGTYNNGANGHQLFVNSTGELGSWEFNITKNWGGLLTLGVSSDGTERTRGLTLNSSGNVGIGTTIPAGRLTITENGGVPVSLVIDSDADRADTSKYHLLIDAPRGTGDQNGIGFGELDNDYVTAAILARDNGVSASTGLDFATGNSAGVFNRMSITSTGNVGIGTIDPQTLLHISGNNNISSNNIVLRFEDTDTNTSANQPLGQIQFYGNDASNAGAGIKVGIKAFSLDNAGNSYLTFSTSDTTSNDQERMRIDKDGNVGIGTNGPDEKLHVVGEIKATANVRSQRLVLRSDAIERWEGAANNAMVANYFGYNGGFDYFRDFVIYNGKGQVIAHFDGPDKRLGIGTTAPAEKLHVDGNIKTSGVIYVSSTSSTALTPAANDWIDIAEMPYGENHGKIALEWSSLYAPSSSHHGWVEIEVGTYYSASFNYGQDTYVELTKALAHNEFWLNSVRAVDYGSTVRIQVQAARAATAGTFRSLVLHKNQGSITPLTPAINNNAYTVLALANVGEIDGEYVQKAIGNHTRFSSDVAFDEKVGIGITSPSDLLTVNGNIGIFGNKIYNGSASNSAGISFPSSTTRIDGYSGVTFHSSATTVGSQSERMRITSGGNIGIGTTSPEGKFQIKGGSGDTTTNADLRVNAENSGIFMDDANAGASRLGLIKKWGDVPVIAAGNATDIKLGHFADVANLAANIQSNTFTPDLTISTDGLIRLHSYGAGYLKTDANGNVSLDTTSYGSMDVWYLHGDTAGDQVSVNDQRVVSFPGATVAGQGTALNPFTVTIPSFSGDYDDLTNKPTLGTAASSAATDFVAVTGDTMTGNLTISPSSGDAQLTLSAAGNAVLNVNAVGASYVEKDTGTSLTLANNVNDQNIYLRTKTGGATTNVVTVTGTTKRVGIGTTSPGSKLQVGPGTSNTPSTVASLGGSESGILSALSLVNTIGNSAAGYGTALDFHVNSGYSPTGRIATIAENTSTPAALAFYTYNAGLNEKMRITSGGNVGIGTASPQSKLEVVGNIDCLGSLINSDFGWEVFFGDSLLFFNGVSILAALTSNGRLGIGVSNPLTPLHVSGSAFIDTGFLYMSDALPIVWGGGSSAIEGNSAARTMTIKSNAKITFQSSPQDTRLVGPATAGMKVVSDAFEFYADITNSIWGPAFAEVFIQMSDESLKKNVTTISGAVDKVKALRGVEFDWKLTDKPGIGFIAQEVEQVVPNVVQQTGTDTKGVNYMGMVALLSEAIKEQQATIEALTARIEALEAK
jgi:hypothetical protein